MAAERRPRVLHLVTRNQPRGAESAALMLADALAGRGYDTRLVALARTTGPELAGVPVLGSSPLGWRTLLRLRSEVRGADVVVAHGSRTLPAVVLAAAGLRRRLIYQNIGDPLFWAGERWRHRRVRFLLGRMSAVAALTEQSAQVLEEHFDVPAGRLLVIRNMRDGHRFHPPTPEGRTAARAALGLEPADRAVAIIGALSPEKRVGLAIEAAARVPGAVLLVAGDGPERPALEQRAAEVPGSTRFLGSLTDVVPLLHACDVLLMTSESEGVPGVLIEAGLCGVPAVSTDVGFVSDVVEHGRTGLLVRTAGAADLAGCLEEALEDRERLGAEARTRCLERFELDSVVDQWTRLLGPAVTDRPGPPSS